jgi:integrase
MKTHTTDTRTSAIRQSESLPVSGRAARAAMARPTAGARYKDPLDYEQHPYDSMKRFAQLLALRYDMARTRHSYYRDLRLLHEHYQCDPAALTEEQFRDYILHVKTRRLWRPKTIRQTAAAARLFFVDLLEHDEWKVFSQIRTKDHHELPAVLTREEVRRLLVHIRLRRYRIPVKLIYCAGLRLSECLSLTIHDIKGDEGKLWVRGGAEATGGRRDRLPRGSPRSGEGAVRRRPNQRRQGPHGSPGKDDGRRSAALLVLSPASAFDLPECQARVK